MFDHLGLLDTGYVNLVEAAIADGRASFNEQAIHSVADVNSIFYHECLATLRSTDGRLYGAATFVPQLEVLGQSSIVDQNMVRMVLNVLESDPHAVLGCNLSADNFVDRDAWDSIARQIHARPHLAPRLIFEVTETRQLANLEGAANMLEEVRNLGCRVALDDFGTGYASPRLLQMINFDIVKVDQSFLEPTRSSEFARNSLANLLGFVSCYTSTIVIEGVETIEQAQLAAMSGATHLQGYGISRPVPTVRHSRKTDGTWYPRPTDQPRADHPFNSNTSF